jgi:hypothetical protein
MTTEVTNKNMLSPTGFNFLIKKTPEVNFFVQSVILPGIQMGAFESPTPFKVIPITGDHVTFGELQVTFKIDENMENYRSLFDWVTQIGFPDNFDQYAGIEAKASYTGEGIYSDATLMILTSGMNANIKVDFVDLFPVSLTDVTMDTRDTNIEYVEASCAFRFRNYTMTRLSA